MDEAFPAQEIRRRLPLLYDSATDLVIQLENTVGDVDAALTPGQMGAFNQLLADARALLPRSVALREDAAEANADTHPGDVHRALNTTIVPTLHNALAPEDYEKRG